MQAVRSLRADARRNRRRLLEAATEAFATDGLSVPLDEIARRAGVGPGTLYRHFPSKELLFEAVLLERFQRLVEEAKALRGSDEPGDALLSFIDRLAAEAAPKRDLIDALASGGTDLSATLAAEAAKLRREIGRLLNRAQASGVIRAGITADDLMALISGVLLSLRSASAARADPQRVLEVLRDGLRG